MAGSFIQGSVAGLAATVPMTMTMASIRKGFAGRHAPLPAEEVAEGVSDKIGLRDELNQKEQDAFNWISHFAFGAATGGIYGLLAGRSPHYAMAKGVTFGMAVWATSYIGVLPVAGVMRPPEDEPKHKVASEVVSHVVWGIALGLITSALSRRFIKPESPNEKADQEYSSKS